MLLIDSSVWIELTRPGRGDLHSRLVASNQLPAITEPILGEVLAGARDVDAVEARLSAVNLRPIDPGRDYRDAAAIFRACRRQGHTVRSLTDCLIAAVAVRFGDTVAHRDLDFERIAEVSPLRTLYLR